MLERYLPLIERLPAAGKLSRDELLTPGFLLEKQGNVEIYYAPHNETVNHSARVVIVGITPGWTQTELAFRQVRDDLQAGVRSPQELARRAKAAARFAGSMRRNLIEMLEACGVAERLDELRAKVMAYQHRG